MSRMFIICGCNGAGKTTASYTLLPDMLNCDEYVDADEIAKSISPMEPSLARLRASRLMVDRIHELIEKGGDFGFETTLATRSLVSLIVKAKKKGYSVNIVYLWLPSAEMAVERVRLRFNAGGHSVPEDTIIRRYYVGIENLIKLYMPVCDTWAIFDNSQSEIRLIARGGQLMETEIANKKLFNRILDQQTS